MALPALTTKEEVRKLLPAAPAGENADALISAAIDNASIYIRGKIAKEISIKNEPIPAVIGLCANYLSASYVITISQTGGAENEQLNLSKYYQEQAEQIIKDILNGNIIILDDTGEPVEAIPADIVHARPFLVYAEKEAKKNASYCNRY